MSVAPLLSVTGADCKPPLVTATQLVTGQVLSFSFIKKLKELFEAHDGAVRRDDFIEAFLQVVPTTDAEAAAELQPQLRSEVEQWDIGKEGVVTWSDCVTLLLELISSNEGQDASTSAMELWDMDVVGCSSGGKGKFRALPHEYLHRTTVTHVYAHPVLPYYFTASPDGSVRVWSADTLCFQMILFKGGSPISVLSPSWDHKLLFVASESKSLLVYDMADLFREPLMFFGAGLDRAAGEIIPVPMTRPLTAELIHLRKIRIERHGNESEEEFRLRFAQQQGRETKIKTSTDALVLHNLSTFVTAVATMPYNDLLFVGCLDGSLLAYPLAKRGTDLCYRMAVPALVAQPRLGEPVVSALFSEVLHGIVTVSASGNISLTPLPSSRAADDNVQSVSVDAAAGAGVGERGQQHGAVAASLVRAAARSSTLLGSVGCSVSRAVWVEPSRLLAVCGVARHAFIFSVPLGVVIATLSSHHSSLVGVSYDAKEELLYTADNRRTIIAWNVRTPEIVARINDADLVDCRRGSLGAVAVDQVRGIVLAGSLGLSAWTRKSTHSICDDKSYCGHHRSLVAMHVVYLMNQLVTADSEEVRVWDLTCGALVGHFQLEALLEPFSARAIKHHGLIVAVDVDAPRRRLLLSLSCGQAVIVHLSTGAVLEVLRLPHRRQGCEDGSGALFYRDLVSSGVIALVASEVCVWHDHGSHSPGRLRHRRVENPAVKGAKTAAGPPVFTPIARATNFPAVGGPSKGAKLSPYTGGAHRVPAAVAAVTDGVDSGVTIDVLNKLSSPSLVVPIHPKVHEVVAIHPSAFRLAGVERVSAPTSPTRRANRRALSGRVNRGEGSRGDRSEPCTPAVRSTTTESTEWDGGENSILEKMRSPNVLPMCVVMVESSVVVGTDHGVFLMFNSTSFELTHCIGDIKWGVLVTRIRYDPATQHIIGTRSDGSVAIASYRFRDRFLLLSLNPAFTGSSRVLTALDHFKGSQFLVGNEAGQLFVWTGGPDFSLEHLPARSMSEAPPAAGGPAAEPPRRGFASAETAAAAAAATSAVRARRVFGTHYVFSAPPDSQGTENTQQPAPDAIATVEIAIQAHSGAISAVSFIFPNEDKDDTRSCLLASCSVDSQLRLFSIDGGFVGYCGAEKGWDLLVAHPLTVLHSGVPVPAPSARILIRRASTRGAESDEAAVRSREPVSRCRRSTLVQGEVRNPSREGLSASRTLGASLHSLVAEPLTLLDVPCWDSSVAAQQVPRAPEDISLVIHRDLDRTARALTTCVRGDAPSAVQGGDLLGASSARSRTWAVDCAAFAGPLTGSKGEAADHLMVGAQQSCSQYSALSVRGPQVRWVDERMARRRRGILKYDPLRMSSTPAFHLRGNMVSQLRQLSPWVVSGRERDSGARQIPGTVPTQAAIAAPHVPYGAVGDVGAQSVPYGKSLSLGLAPDATFVTNSLIQASFSTPLDGPPAVRFPPLRVARPHDSSCPNNGDTAETSQWRPHSATERHSDTPSKKRSSVASTGRVKQQQSLRRHTAPWEYASASRVPTANLLRSCTEESGGRAPRLVRSPDSEAAQEPSDLETRLSNWRYDKSSLDLILSAAQSGVPCALPNLSPSPKIRLDQLRLAAGGTGDEGKPTRLWGACAAPLQMMNYASSASAAVTAASFAGASREELVEHILIQRALIRRLFRRVVDLESAKGAATAVEADAVLRAAMRELKQPALPPPRPCAVEDLAHVPSPSLSKAQRARSIRDGLQDIERILGGMAGGTCVVPDRGGGPALPVEMAAELMFLRKELSEAAAALDDAAADSARQRKRSKTAEEDEIRGDDLVTICRADLLDHCAAANVGRDAAASGGAAAALVRSTAWTAEAVDALLPTLAFCIVRQARGGPSVDVLAPDDFVRHVFRTEELLDDHSQLVLAPWATFDPSSTGISGALALAAEAVEVPGYTTSVVGGSISATDATGRRPRRKRSRGADGAEQEGGSIDRDGGSTSATATPSSVARGVAPVTQRRPALGKFKQAETYFWTVPTPRSKELERLNRLITTRSIPVDPRVYHLFCVLCEQLPLTTLTAACCGATLCGSCAPKLPLLAIAGSNVHCPVCREVPPSACVHHPQRDAEVALLARELSVLYHSEMEAVAFSGSARPLASSSHLSGPGPGMAAGGGPLGVEMSGLLLSAPVYDWRGRGDVTGSTPRHMLNAPADHGVDSVLGARPQNPTSPFRL